MTTETRRVLPDNLIELLKGRRYSLRGYRLGPVGARGLFGHERLSAYIARAEDLDLTGNHIGDAGLAHLARSSIAPGLTSLDLSDCRITEHGIRLLDAFPRLSFLCLHDNPIGPDGARALAELTIAPRLEELRLSMSGIGDEGLAALGRVVTAAHVDLAHAGLGPYLGVGPGMVLRPSGSLNLGGNTLAGQGARTLAAWRPQPAQLSLQHTGLDDEGLAALFEAGVFTRASYIDLRGNDLSVHGLRGVAFRPGAIVKLGGARLQQVEVGALRRERDELRISFDAVPDGVVLSCPYCGREHGVSEPLCPHCGEDVTRDASTEEPAPFTPVTDGSCVHCDAELVRRAMRCGSCQSWVPAGSART